MKVHLLIQNPIGYSIRIVSARLIAFEKRQWQRQNNLGYVLRNQDLSRTEFDNTKTELGKLLLVSYLQANCTGQPPWYLHITHKPPQNHLSTKRISTPTKQPNQSSPASEDTSLSSKLFRKTPAQIYFMSYCFPPCKCVPRFSHAIHQAILFVQNCSIP